MIPILTLRSNGAVAWYEDSALRDDGILVAFSTRTGGVSEEPYDSLDLAGHVGDAPSRVDENRRRLLEAVGVGSLAGSVVTAEQVHADHVGWMLPPDAGRGARASGAVPPVAETDALLTEAPGLPLMLLYADCVPIVVVDPRSRRIAVIHAGWRGAFARLPGACVRELVGRGSKVEDLSAYVGPHICAKHYEVGETLVSRFVNRFGTVAEAAAGHLDLGAVVSEDLTSSGVYVENVCRLGLCTAEATDRFFSYRVSSGVTGRHAALSVILG